MRADCCGVRARHRWRAWEHAQIAVAQASHLEMKRLLCGFQLYAAATQPTAAPSNPEQPPCTFPQDRLNFPRASRANMRGVWNRVKGSDGPVPYYTTERGGVFASGAVGIFAAEVKILALNSTARNGWRL